MIFEPVEWYTRKNFLDIVERRVFRSSDWTTIMYVLKRSKNLDIGELKRLLRRSLQDPSYFQIQKNNGKVKVIVHLAGRQQIYPRRIYA